MSSKVLPALSLSAGILMLMGCSGPQEDPRVTFCRGMAADLAGGDVSAWRHADNRIVEPEYAVVKVQSGGETVSCWYEYSAVEPGAMEQANPQLAYATLPYQVRVKGRMIKGQALSRAVRQQQVELGQAVVEQARQGLNKAVETARDVVDKVNAR